MRDARDVLVIDDEAERLEPLAAALTAKLGTTVGVRTWLPIRGVDPLERFEAEVGAGVALIVTDQDLTKSGLGLLGSSVTSWAQDRYIPVCNFSRQPERKLPREQNFFELRVPAEPDEAARANYIARIYRGFERVRNTIASTEPGPVSQLLAAAMELPELEDDVAPFLTSVASASSSLVQTFGLGHDSPTDIDRVNVLAFILGHVLVNAILRFPGPILSRPSLAAYCAVSEQMTEHLVELFSEAAYTGPFSASGMYFVRDRIDQRIDELSTQSTETSEETDEYVRSVVEATLGEALPHGCTRCSGTRGGYWCPFTQRAVCNRSDCSVASDTWLPRGATLCRVERDYFEQLAPLLGE